MLQRLLLLLLSACLRCRVPFGGDGRPRLTRRFLLQSEYAFYMRNILSHSFLCCASWTSNFGLLCVYKSRLKCDVPINNKTKQHKQQQHQNSFYFNLEREHGEKSSSFSLFTAWTDRRLLQSQVYRYVNCVPRLVSFAFLLSIVSSFVPCCCCCCQGMLF